MDGIPDLLLGPQRATTSGYGVALTLIAVVLASTLMIYLLRCYIQEGRIRRRIKQRSHQQFGGNIVPAIEASVEAARPVRKASESVLPPQREERNTKVRRRARGSHPWKQHHFHPQAQTPH